jgi:hypothetical protein
MIPPPCSWRIMECCPTPRFLLAPATATSATNRHYHYRYHYHSVPLLAHASGEIPPTWRILVVCVFESPCKSLATKLAWHRRRSSKMDTEQSQRFWFRGPVDGRLSTIDAFSFCDCDCRRKSHFTRRRCNRHHSPSRCSCRYFVFVRRVADNHHCQSLVAAAGSLRKKGYSSLNHTLARDDDDAFN